MTRCVTFYDLPESGAAAGASDEKNAFRTHVSAVGVPL